MKLYAVGGVVGEVFVQLCEVVCYPIGKTIVPWVTLWCARTEEPDEHLTFAWYGVARGRDGKTVLSERATEFVGLAVLIMVAVVVVWIFNTARQSEQPGR